MSDLVIPVMSPIEQKWFTKIILNDMKLGLRHGPLLARLAPGAESRWEECTNLREVDG
jgi:hypothetical protein